MNLMDQAIDPASPLEMVLSLSVPLRLREMHKPLSRPFAKQCAALPLSQGTEIAKKSQFLFLLFLALNPRPALLSAPAPPREIAWMLVPCAPFVALREEGFLHSSENGE